MHTWCPSTSTWTPAQNGAVFRHWVPDISLPSSVPEYKVETRARALYPNSGLGTWKNGVFTLVPIKNRSRAPRSGTKSERSLRDCNLAVEYLKSDPKDLGLVIYYVIYARCLAFSCVTYQEVKKSPLIDPATPTL